MSQKLQIALSSDLTEGAAVKFSVPATPQNRDGFAIRIKGLVHAYYNECPHIGLPLDWNDADFLKEDCSRIVCKNHCAEFAPDSGICTEGPCLGAQLKVLTVTEENNAIFINMV